MEISDKGLKFLEHVEAKKNHVYPDSGGEPTIGIGHLLTKSERSSGKLKLKDETGEITIIDYRGLKTLSDAQIYALLRYDLISVESTVNTWVKVKLRQHEYDALISFCFNIGNEAFKNSTLLKRLNAGAFGEVEHQMRRWNKDNGKVVQGLINRRVKEIALWKGDFQKAFE